MSEAELVFDTSMKKKKKKSSGEQTAQTEEEKKKLKSKTLAMMNQQDEEDEQEEKRNKEEAAAAAAAAEGNEDAEEDFSNTDFGAKKKKKKSSSSKESSTKEEKETTSTATDKVIVEDGQLPWLGTDRDYKYSELTYRIYHLLQANNPDLISSEKRQMKPPKVLKDGTKKIIWANFAEICQILNRKPEHVLQYVFAELGTNGSVDGNERLVIRGRFNTSQIEVVIRHYIAEYVACRNCRSPNTTLERNNRLYFLCCNACNSKRSVAVIKKGMEGAGKKQAKE
ncbi:hypothetical protein CYY_000497 [Polysphondylium violaceum]|uniref:Translation initiation factor IF2/IF5 domain-containing protein n=1 Tax=Polysphondylium violaceum TaxID=133409 RepID=A0A8J4Q4L8_9MYCE|nr:hypothetical protein CYY_000497 [Polysphondylium violaceum]